MLTIVGALGAVVVFVLAVSPKPTTIEFNLAVNAPYGGIFEDDCSLTTDGRSLGATDATVVDYGAEPSSGTKTALLYELSEAGCSATAQISLFPGKTYDVYVGEKLVGQISTDDVEAGRASAVVDLEVTRDLEGTIVLSDNYINCKAADKGTSCTIPIGSASVWAQFQKQPFVCYGMNSYSDFKQTGTAVVITGLSSGQTVRTQLSKGSPSVTDYKTGKIECEYQFSARDLIYDEKGYRIKVGRHNAEPATISELNDAEWKYSFEFKG